MSFQQVSHAAENITVIAIARVVKNVKIVMNKYVS